MTQHTQNLNNTATRTVQGGLYAMFSRNIFGDTFYLNEKPSSSHWSTETHRVLCKRLGFSNEMHRLQEQWWIDDSQTGMRHTFYLFYICSTIVECFICLKVHYTQLPSHRQLVQVPRYKVAIFNFYLF